MSQYNINELIQSFLSKNNKTTQFKERTVVDLWHQVMGDFIAKHTRSVSMKNGILYVSLTNASLRFEGYYCSLICNYESVYRFRNDVRDIA
jgi:hypothetical protein